MTGLKVRPMEGERWRYYVDSGTHDDETHVVDLAENNGNGVCSCRYYEVTCGPNYHRNDKKMVPYERNEKGKVVQGVSQCKHIAAVRNYILADMLPRMVGDVQHSRAAPVTVKASADGLPF